MNPNSSLARLNRARVWRPILRVWGFAVTPPTFDRWLYLGLHRLGVMGREEKRFLERTIRPGMQVADVGANIGLYTLLMARLAGPRGRVFAFEPEPAMAEALDRNLKANQASQVEIFRCAAGASAGQGFLWRRAFNSGDTRLRSEAPDPPGAASSVPIRALQEALQGRRVDFIKLDVQGWEGEALRGMDGLFRSNPGLVLYFEFWPHGLRAAGTSIAELKRILSALGLRTSTAEAGGGVEIDLEERARRMKPKGYINLLARRA